MILTGLLPDHEILTLGHQLVEPFNPRCVQPASYDLSLHPDVLVPPGTRFAQTVDLRTDDPKSLMRPLNIGTGYELLPGGCLIASTAEVIHCAPDIAARVEGKSSLGRLFLSVHVTAGWLDPGWSGQVTLEMVNHGSWSIMLWAGMKIAQVNFTRMATPCAAPYGSVGLGSHYQNQRGPTAAAGRRAHEQQVDVQEGPLGEVAGRGQVP